MIKPKIIVILGATASGKSEMAVLLAKKFNGEIISADSRQVYKGLNIGTGKITKREMKSVPHHLLDIAHPQKQFTVAEYKRLAGKAIEKIIKTRRIPIIVGGTGFYIAALLGEVQIPEVEPNKTLRRKLEEKSVSELFEILKRLDLKRASTIDSRNPRRLVRAIEIVETLGSVPKSRLRASGLDVLKIGIKIPDGELRRKINNRLAERIKRGMINEARQLHKQTVSFDRMRELGLEYRRLADFLQGKINKAELVSLLQNEIWQYAKRQKTWFKKDKKIIWLPPRISLIEKEVGKFL